MNLEFKLMIEEALDSIPEQSYSRQEIQDLYARGIGFHTPQVFCVFLTNDQFSRTAVFGSSATANDDYLPHLLALVVDDEYVHSLRFTTHIQSVIDTLGLEVDQ